MLMLPSSFKKDVEGAVLIISMLFSAALLWLSGYTSGMRVAKNTASCEQKVVECSKDKAKEACLYEVYHAEGAECNSWGLRP